MALAARVLFRTPLVAVTDVSCDVPRSGRDRETSDPVSSLTIVRRGVHAYHARGQVAVAEPGLALIYRGGEPYCLSHPYERHGPDRSSCIEFDNALLEEAFGARKVERDLGFHLGPHTIALHLQALSEFKGQDGLGAAEAALEVLRAAATDFGSLREDRGSPATAWRRVARARALIAAEPHVNHSIENIAAEAACSPFHLARLFRRHTGMSLRGYRLRLRLALALERLAEGAEDLTAVALDAGFSDHAHLTASFRKLLGATPSELRGRLKERKFLKAA